MPDIVGRQSALPHRGELHPATAANRPVRYPNARFPTYLAVQTQRAREFLSHKPARPCVAQLDHTQHARYIPANGETDAVG